MNMLLVGYNAVDLFEKAKHGKKVTAKWAEGATCHTLDIYHRHAIEKTHHLKAVCSPHLPAGPWDEIRFRTGPKRMAGELELDLLQEIYALAPEAKLFGGNGSGPVVTLEYDGRERDRNALLDKIRKDKARHRDFASTWQASLPGIEPVTFTSFPGCFCHRRQDEGGLALAEVVARDLSALIDESTNRRIDESTNRRIDEFSLLDMGCGCGLVSLLIAKAVKGVKAVLVDSHSRAVEAAELNAKNLGVEAEVILADNGTPARMDGTFDVFVGNPPYYSDYRIAEVFLETAKRALKSGGVCYTVCKNAAGLEPVQRKYFPAVEIVHRRGYSVLKSVKE